MTNEEATAARAGGADPSVYTLSDAEKKEFLNMEASLPAHDPTAYNLHAGAEGGWGGAVETGPSAHDKRYSQDPFVRHVNGWSNYGGIRLDFPFVTKVDDNLYHGGCETGLVLPEFIKNLVSLYPWEKYAVAEGQLLEELVIQAYDHHEQDLDWLDAAAEKVNEMRQTGPTLVHCQAGINRSSLVIARALFLNGDVDSGQEAIDLLRRKRSVAVLCNPGFERAVQGWSR